MGLGRPPEAISGFLPDPPSRDTRHFINFSCFPRIAIARWLRGIVERSDDDRCTQHKGLNGKRIETPLTP